MNICQHMSHAAAPEKTIETSNLWNLENGERGHGGFSGGLNWESSW